MSDVTTMNGTSDSPESSQIRGSSPSSISTLPRELLENVLLFSIRLENCRERNVEIAAISGVSSDFRYTLFSLTSIWASIWISFGIFARHDRDDLTSSPGAVHAAYYSIVHEWLFRANDLPLSITLHTTCFDQLRHDHYADCWMLHREILKPYNLRISCIEGLNRPLLRRIVSIDNYITFDGLKYLSFSDNVHTEHIEVLQDLPRIAPNLKHFKAWNIYVWGYHSLNPQGQWHSSLLPGAEELSSVPMFFYRLTHLQMNVAIRGIANFLVLCPNLKCLVLDIQPNLHWMWSSRRSDLLNHPGQQDLTKPILQKLRRLTIHIALSRGTEGSTLDHSSVGIDAIRILFHNTVFPRLTTLSIHAVLFPRRSHTLSSNYNTIPYSQQMPKLRRLVLSVACVTESSKPSPLDIRNLPRYLLQLHIPSMKYLEIRDCQDLNLHALTMKFDETISKAILEALTPGTVPHTQNSK